MKKKVLQAIGIGKSYPAGGATFTALHNLHFHAHANEFVSFVGPSGCGKSTLFNIITGLLAPDNGDILIKERETTGSPSAELGYVLQKDLLFPWRTVMENVILGLEVRGTPKREARRRAGELFERYHMQGYENKYPSQLSGGMRQRAALMRTMVTNPEIILMDEAYKALDYPLKIALESELLSVVKQQKKTVIFITHDIEEAVTLSDRVYVMKARPGEIVHEIAIDLQTESLSIPERRLSPRFNDYYEQIWRSIGSEPALLT
ncbi:ABC transporter ATP-binding protein [Affinibrenneria salicis]|uniref:ABC transporter ATP-binding protein n=1 Tax=Affinibrenneria salicis TaxID=2590031 RepID=A0A5J5FYZ3_9GAMM|nr:ABC transporter ATP-binding protein [Affinibrenneria salicis]KAA8999438.1 ABC transporter ATP-binding protein [Affinibrenneria salicis]